MFFNVFNICYILINLNKSLARSFNNKGFNNKGSW